MEAILIDSVQKSISHFMHSNAIFLSHRLCAQFPSEVSLSLSLSQRNSIEYSLLSNRDRFVLLIAISFYLVVV
jgi:hypothetical protein